MKRIGIILAGIGLLAISARAQERKIELAPFAGGYFSAGFQSLKFVEWGPIVLPSERLIAPTFTVRDFKPVAEPSSGIFGVRASYDLTRRLTLEGTFGFSPAGRKFLPSPIVIPIAELYPPSPAEPVPPQPGQVVFGDIEGFPGFQRPILAPFIGGKDTYHYSGNVLFRWPGVSGWTPFITGGLGAITRTAEFLIPWITPGPFPQQSPWFDPYYDPYAYSIFVTPSPTDTDFSVNFGGGVKKYFSDRYGIRFDFRDSISKVDEDTVHNIETSMGLIVRF